jgi:hypothetical protein
VSCDFFFIFRFAHTFRLLNSFTLSGQPRVLQRESGDKILVYTAFMANGECWPPVLFTSKPLPNRGESEIRRLKDSNQFAFVHYLPDNSAPSSLHTEIWLSDMNSLYANMLQGQHHLICDKAPWHTSQYARDLFDFYDITPHYIPGGTGKWLNPCDQAIHREMRRTYNQLQQLRHSDKIDNIITAYYSVSPAAVDGSWRHTALLEGDCEDHLTKVSQEGYHATAEREAHFAIFSEKFDLWANASLGSRRVADAEPRDVRTLDTGLDGPYWSPAGVAGKRRAV